MDESTWTIVQSSTGKNDEQDDDILFLSGCSDTEESEDVGGGLGSTPHGALSDAYFNVLKNANYQISIGDLLIGIHKYLNAEGITTQHPQYGSNKPLDLTAPFSLLYSAGTRHLR